MFSTVNQKVKVSLVVKDKFGNLARVHGIPKWSLSASEFGSLLVAENGMSAEFTPSGVFGLVKVQVVIDADLSAGVNEIVREIQLALLSVEPESFELFAEVI